MDTLISHEATGEDFVNGSEAATDSSRSHDIDNMKNAVHSYYTALSFFNGHKVIAYSKEVPTERVCHFGCSHCLYESLKQTLYGFIQEWNIVPCCHVSAVALFGTIFFKKLHHVFVSEVCTLNFPGDALLSQLTSIFFVNDFPVNS